ncbi:hypothetical protein GGX14DRAFT_558596 [Mycena pura]|uniref:Uncharacterized protein n=1 Tax=Mycena pura TaxID=153505 RepID=A0AAD6YLC8_9AGAR|nr:hypothetical protein GGX14DRAFT_558596 [Mycena pura]
MANPSLSARRFPVDESADSWALRWFQCFSPQGTSTKPIVDTIVSDSLGDIVFISEPNHRGDHILVRPEYPGIWAYVQAKRAERDLAGTHTFGGLVVWGSPGIGKTSLLSYLLALALSNEIFVILSLTPDYIIVFPPGELPYKIIAADFSIPNFPRNALVLCESAGKPDPPPSVFVQPSANVFVVQATSPTESRYKGWAKDKEAELWPMDLWTGREFQKLIRLRQKKTPQLPCVPRMLNPFEDVRNYTALELFLLLGPSLRHTKIQRRNTGRPELDLADLISAPDLFSDASALSRGDQKANFHQYFFALPPHYDGKCKAVSYRGPGYIYIVPTSFLAARLATSLEKLALEDQVRFSALFAPAPQVAGALYEALMPKFLTKGDKGLLGEFNDREDYRLDGKLEMESCPFLPGTRDIVYGKLLVPPGGYPAVDALYCTLSEDEKTLDVVMLQATIARSHAISTKGVQPIVKMAAKTQKNVRYQFLFVSPSREIGQHLAQAASNQTTLGRGAQRLVIPVGWVVMKLPDGFDTSLTAFEQRDKEFKLLDLDYLDPDDAGEVEAEAESETETEAAHVGLSSPRVRRRESDEDEGRRPAPAGFD